MRCERRSIWVIGISLCGLVALGLGSVVVTGQNGASALRDLADRRGFVIGAPMGGIPWNQGPQYRTVFAREFNSGIVFVFPKLTQPERGRFQFRGMDVLAQFAREHKEKLFDVTLVYRNPTSPAWLRFDQRDCGGWSPAELDQIMKTQIQAVVEHGGDAFSIWEPIDEPLGYGGGCWERILGRDALIAHAFTYAKQANPHAQLLLNETFGHRGLDAGRVDAFFEIVRNQKAAGTPIDAVGTEMHLEAPLRPNYLEEFRYFLAQARRAGVRAYVTEMDVYQGPPAPGVNLMTHQATIYHDVVSTCLADSNCRGFYTWGITDSHNWPATRPRDPLPDARPLLFDSEYNKKPAYEAVQRALTGQP